MTGPELRQALYEAGVPPLSIFHSDDRYALPNSTWLLGEFDAWYRAALEALGISAWRDNAWDCDDFSDLYVALARICHARTSGAGAGLAIGTIEYRSAQHGPHCIVAAVTSDRGVLFIEPQLKSTAVAITRDEANTTWHAKF